LHWRNVIVVSKQMRSWQVIFALVLQIHRPVLLTSHVVSPHSTNNYVYKDKEPSNNVTRCKILWQRHSEGVKQWSKQWNKQWVSESVSTAVRSDLNWFDDTTTTTPTTPQNTKLLNNQRKATNFYWTKNRKNHTWVEAVEARSTV
jgi:hypothetical protein